MAKKTALKGKTELKGKSALKGKTEPKSIPTVPSKAKVITPPKKGSKKLFCLGCGCLFIIFVVIILALVVFVIGADGFGGGSFIVRGENYDGAYNYDALNEAPWISDSDEQEKFLERKKELSDLGIEIDGDYYKEIMETELEDVYGQLMDEDGDNSSDSGNSDDSDNSYSTDQITNADYNYSFGIDNAHRYVEVAEAYELSGYPYSTYNYCYQLDDDTYDGGELCQDGYVSLFIITVFIEEQYLDYMEEDPFSEFAILIGEGNGLYFLLELPNGDLPDEVSDFYEDMLDQVYQTFEYTSHEAG